MSGRPRRRPHRRLHYCPEGFTERLVAALERIGAARHAVHEGAWGAMGRAAKRLGVSAAAVSQWCSGDVCPMVHHLVEICRLTPCSMDWLLRGD